MPGGNGTGPMGMCSMTGRAAGFCAGFGTPGYANVSVRRGFGVGYGRGREFRGRKAGHGFRHMFQAAGLPGWRRFRGYDVSYKDTDSDFKKQTLKNQVNNLRSELDFIKKRLSEIEIDTTAKETPACL